MNKWAVLTLALALVGAQALLRSPSLAGQLQSAVFASAGLPGVPAGSPHERSPSDHSSSAGSRHEIDGSQKRSASGGGCGGAADCDDGDGCTIDSCIDFTCVHSPIDCPNNEECLDGVCDQPTQFIHGFVVL